MRLTLSNLKKILDLPHLLLAVICFCFLLSVYAGLSLFAQVKRLKTYKEQVMTVEAKIPLFEAVARQQDDLLQQLLDANPRYLEQHLGSLHLLRLETYSLEVNKQELSQNEKDRLEFLLANANTLHFLPGRTIKSALSQTVELKLEHPVEVDEKDIQRILARIEGTTIGSYGPADLRPPMTIKKFSLRKKQEPTQRFPSYLLNMELCYREALQKS